MRKDWVSSNLYVRTGFPIIFTGICKDRVSNNLHGRTGLHGYLEAEVLVLPGQGLHGRGGAFERTFDLHNLKETEKPV